MSENQPGRHPALIPSAIACVILVTALVAIMNVTDTKDGALILKFNPGFRELLNTFFFGSILGGVGSILGFKQGKRMAEYEADS